MDLFNIYFDASSTRSNFAIPSDPAAIGVGVTRTSYTYILMSKTDWQSIQDATRAAIEQRYNLLEDNKGLLVFFASQMTLSAIVFPACGVRVIGISGGQSLVCSRKVWKKHKGNADLDELDTQ